METFGGRDKEEMEKVLLLLLLLLTRQLSSGVQAEFRSAASETQQQLLRNRAIRNGDVGVVVGGGGELRVQTPPVRITQTHGFPHLSNPAPRPPPPQLAARELTSAAAPAPHPNHTEGSLTARGESEGPPLASHHAARASEIEQENGGDPLGGWQGAKKRAPPLALI